jgi:hypothetical protein
MEDLCMDESDGRHDIILDSPPKPNRHPKKHQQPPSSPTPSPPSLAFAAPQKPHTAIHDNRGTFKTHASQLMGHRGATNSTLSVASSLNTSCTGSLGRGCTGKQGSSAQQSSTSQTSVSAKSKGKESVSKHIRSEVQEQVEMLSNDLNNLHSEKVSLYQLKNE